MLRADTSSSGSSYLLRPATAGSLGLDLATAVTVVLMTTHPEKVGTGTKGPIVINGQAMGALLIGRSLPSMLGLFVLPGIIDADYEGEIKIMVYTPFPPMKIEKGQYIAQLIPLPQTVSHISPSQATSHHDKGFGSTGGLTLLTLDLSTRPRRPVAIQYQAETITMDGLLDTGADSSIVGPEYWPTSWPILPSTATVTGVGGLTLAKRTPPVTIRVDNKIVHTTLAIVDLPHGVQCLLGRDILAQLGVILTNEHPLA
ncbi:hypothetical protein DV515_00008547 [Chloebia gouldiae]|uniref:Peptidase A2 domain-containing protein n=1 Tax=Chloebia gouldiae TaxID=44316 RepID=A0A3L8SFI8_CHLGU|nr:hypothetical protein DV515_00008547 [Chloebia gouldiae]